MQKETKENISTQMKNKVYNRCPKELETQYLKAKSVMRKENVFMTNSIIQTSLDYIHLWFYPTNNNNDCVLLV